MRLDAARFSAWPTRMLRIVLAILHLVALGIGLGAVWARARALGERPLNRGSARRAITADAWRALSAMLWISTGVWRLLAGTEKATAYYLSNRVFMAKMGFLAAILLLELWPIVTLVRWRRAAARGGSSWTPDVWQAATVRLVSYVEAALVIAMVAAAVMMARGYGTVGPR
jgi:putative membrane protein